MAKTSLKNKMWIALSVIIALTVVAHEWAFIAFTSNTEVMTINALEVKRKRNEDDKYLVFTDKGEFENVDNWWILKTNSSSLQNTLATSEKEDAKVKVSYYGWRVTWFGWYPNITDVETVK